MTLIELGLLSMLGIYNSPFEKKFTVQPSLMMKHYPSPKVYFGLLNSARCTPTQLTSWNPITAKWGVEMGYESPRLKVFIGHLSEHGIDRKVSTTESYDYIGLKYEFMLK